MKNHLWFTNFTYHNQNQNSNEYWPNFAYTIDEQKVGNYRGQQEYLISVECIAIFLQFSFSSKFWPSLLPPTHFKVVVYDSTWSEVTFNPNTQLMRNVRARFIQFYVILKWKECYNEDIQQQKQQQEGKRRKGTHTHTLTGAMRTADEKYNNLGVMWAWQLQNFRIYQRLLIETVERHESAWNWLTHKGENSAKQKRLASPKEAHVMPTDTHTDTKIHIHSHIVTTTTTTTTFIHTAQETTRRLVNFWIADSQKNSGY